MLGKAYQNQMNTSLKYAIIPPKKQLNTSLKYAIIPPIFQDWLNRLFLRAD